jgi:lipoprotein-releasing system ATP-binding protein
MADLTSLSCHALTFAYRGKRQVIRDLSLEFRAGEVTAITGASGSGKSTLLYVLSLMLRPTAGTVAWKGAETSSLPDAGRAAWRAAHAGFVFQDAMLDPARTVLGNVCEAGVYAGSTRADAKRRAHELLEKFGVAHRADHRPGEISGGQAQRVALCRALLARPQVVFGDEPTGNLDSDSAEVVWSALQEHAAEGAAVLVATHDLALAARAARHVRLP